MPTVRNVAKIKSSLLHPALTSHFEVTIPRPPGLTDNYLTANGLTPYTGLQEQLNLMCSEATLPGSNLATFEINDNFHGVTERHAYRRVYDDRIDLTFYVNADNYMPIRYFEIWMKYISGESVSAGGGMLSSKNSNYFYRVNYPDKYMCFNTQSKLVEIVNNNEQWSVNDLSNSNKHVTWQGSQCKINTDKCTNNNLTENCEATCYTSPYYSFNLIYKNNIWRQPALESQAGSCTMTAISEETAQNSYCECNNVLERPNLQTKPNMDENRTGKFWCLS